MIISHGDGYELQINGKPFSVAWDRIRTKNNFDWDNKDKKHDPYEAKSFGDNLDNAMKTTSRETGMSKSIAMSLANDAQAEMVA